MTLMKEKTIADKKASECMDLSRQVEALKKEVDLVSPAQRATTLKQARALSAPMKDTPEVDIITLLPSNMHNSLILLANTYYANYNGFETLAS